jgi:hypothetical protein
MPKATNLVDTLGKKVTAMASIIIGDIIKNYSRQKTPWDIPVELPIPTDTDLLSKILDRDTILTMDVISDELAIALQAQVSQAQWDAFVVYQDQLIAEVEAQVVNDDYATYQAYCEALVRDGKNLTSDNLEPYYDALKVKKDKVKEKKVK